jgi:hypothetical protein
MSDLATLRKELKEARKSMMPTPISRMKKADCAAELARMKGIHGAEVKKVEEVLSTAPPKVAKKVKSVQETAHKKVESVAKKTKDTSKVTVPTTSDKPKKGSEEMKARMAALREKRAKKSE